MASTTACIGCKALVPVTEGPTHAYIGASAGCWAIYGDVLAREFGEYGYPPVHRLTVDTYAVQHPGTPSRRSIQSVCVHLISMALVLNHDFSARRATAIRMALRHRGAFVWLEPPPSLGSVTILDVAQAFDLAEHEKAVRRWAAAVWDAWFPHHGTIQHWVEQWVLSSGLSD